MAARTQERYPGVDETRALMLTREYLFDSVHRPRRPTSLVRLAGPHIRPGDPGPAGQWRPSDALADLVKELSDVRTLDPRASPGT